MKISQFAAKFQVSTDTIRYYMELNLIIPEKKGGHYFFDQKCEKQMAKVLDLKDMGFSLQEIKNILYYQKISHLTDYQKNHYYRSIFHNKLIDIEKEIGHLTKARQKIITQLSQLESKENRDLSSKGGIPLMALPLFACPVCGQELLLEAEKVRVSQVINGSLNCSCGVSLQIKDGILYAGNLNKNQEKIPENFFEEYLQNTDSDYVGKLVHGLEWMQRQINPSKLTNKVILEPGSGFGFLLRQIYQKLPANSIYICIDWRANINILLKEILETIEAKVKVIFITAELPVLPLKKDTIDVVIDYTGTSNYSFYKAGFLLELLDKYLKREAKLFGSYIIFRRFGPENTIPEKYRDCYKETFIKNKILSLGYKPQREQSMDLVVDKVPGKYENFARTGDKVEAYQLAAERWG